MSSRGWKYLKVLDFDVLLPNVCWMKSLFLFHTNFSHSPTFQRCKAIDFRGQPSDSISRLWTEPLTATPEKNSPMVGQRKTNIRPDNSGNWHADKKMRRALYLGFSQQWFTVPVLRVLFLMQDKFSDLVEKKTELTAPRDRCEQQVQKVLK